MKPFSTTAYGKLLVSYEGTGRIITADDSFRCDFECSQMHDGMCVLAASTITSASAPGTLRLPFPDVVRFEGTLKDGRQVESNTPIHQINALALPEDADQFALIAFRLRSFTVGGEQQRISEIRYGLTNFFFSGTGRRVRDRLYALPLRLSNSGAEISVQVVPTEEQGRLRTQVITTRSIAVTAEVVCRLNEPVDPDVLPTFDEAVSDLTYVLSVAAGTKVQWIYRITGPDSENHRSYEHRHRVTRPYAPLSPIPHDWNADQQAALIEPGYAAFREKRDRYRLQQVIDTYIEAKTEGDFIETRALKLAVALEALKHAFVVKRGWEAELFLEDKRFKKLVTKLRQAIRQVLTDEGVETDTIEEITKSGNEGGLNRRTFGQVVSALAEELGLAVSKGEMTAFSRSRNTLVHQGRFYASVANNENLARMPYGSPREEYFFDLFFLDRLVLRLLDYEGEFLDARSPQKPRVVAMREFLPGQGDPTVDQN